MFFTSILASKWLKPVLIGLAVIAIFVGLFWGAAHTIKTWEENIYNSAYAKAQGEALVAQNAKLAELTEKVEALTKESRERADAMVAQQKSFQASTSKILDQIKNKPVFVVNESGQCVPTPEAIKTWNDLSNSLQLQR